jgi:hypothetical protein
VKEQVSHPYKTIILLRCSNYSETRILNFRKNHLKINVKSRKT